MNPEVISRRRVYSDTVDLIFKYKGETRIGREFSSDCSLWIAGMLLDIQKRLSAEFVIFPDMVHETDRGRICVSAPAEGLKPFSGEPRNFSELYQPLEELHSAGFLHLGLTCDSYMLQGNRCVLMAWGDPFLSESALSVPEVECGGYPSPASDYYLLGSMLSAHHCRIWNGNGKVDPKALKSRSIRKRLRAMNSLPAKLPAGRLPQPKSFTQLTGGSWRERDIVLNEFLSSAAANGWQTGIVRCRAQESHRPLPGAAVSRVCIESPRDLVESVFSRMDGVSRLLVIDQVDHASSDLMYVLGRLSEIITSDLAVLITSAEEDLSDRIAEIRTVRLSGPCCTASILDPEEALDLERKRAHPFHTGNGFQLRTDEVKGLEPIGLSADELFSEGAYRFLSSEDGRVLVDDFERHILADSYMKLGQFDRALDFVDEDDHVRMGQIFHEKAEFHTSLHHFKKAISGGSAPEKLGLPYIKSLVETGSRKQAESILRSSDDIGSIEYLSWILDCDGRIKEAIEMLDDALSRTVSEERIPLLTSKTVHCMRLGMYDKALITISEAKMLADQNMDPDQKEICYITMGRVLEVMGLWQDALDHYRIATSLARESYDLDYVSRLVHRYVLEFKMGNLLLAGNTLAEMKSIRAAESSSIYSQRISMIEAYSGVMLCRGKESLNAVNIALSKSDKMKRPLMKGICMLYKGQLLVQADEYAEGQKLIELARAVGIDLEDKHLILLSDLAMCYIQQPVDDCRIIASARELKLRFEELQARVIFEAGERRDEAFEELLNLPAPLKAVELASNFGIPEDIKLRNRILGAYRKIIDMLDVPGRELFRRANSSIQSLLADAESDRNTPDRNLIMSHVHHVSQWIPSFTSGHADICDLCSRMGLNCSDQPPADDYVNTVVIDLPEEGRCYVSGDDVSGIRMLEPVIGSVMGICHSYSDAKEDSDPDFPEIVAGSESILKIMQRIRKIANTEVPVLITGETGTGKDLVARAIYRTSGNRGPFVTVDCGAIPENLIEAELFGSSKGSYTDSRSDRPGLIETARGGTLFLDEIGNMPLQLQAKLLRILETGVLRRIGETRERKVDFRLISATNSDLAEQITAGLFRSDLYYRIAVMVINVPPLRERLEDIPLLVKHFTGELCEAGDTPPAFLKSSMTRLCSHSWPGNVRELRNVVQRAMLLCSNRVIREKDICFGNQTEPGSECDNGHIRTLEDAVTHHVYHTYSRTGNKTQAAELLQCDPKTVSKYVKKYESRFRDP